MRVLKISCSLLFVAALAQNAGAQASEQSAQRGVKAQAAALSSAKKPKSIESSAQLPTRVIINTQSAASVRTPDAARAARQLGAVRRELRADESAGQPIVAPSGAPKKAAKNRSSRQ